MIPFVVSKENTKTSVDLDVKFNIKNRECLLENGITIKPIIRAEERTKGMGEVFIKLTNIKEGM